MWDSKRLSAKRKDAPPTHANTDRWDIFLFFTKICRIRLQRNMPKISICSSI